jgi:hypothetical protein
MALATYMVGIEPKRGLKMKTTQKQQIKQQINSNACAKSRYMIPLTSGVWNAVEKTLETIRVDFKGNEYLAIGRGKFGALTVLLNDSNSDV